MAEEEVVVVETPEVTKPVERDFVAEATAMGWNAEFDGEGKVDAREFVLRKPIFDEQKKLKRKVRELENAIRTQTQMQESVIIKERENLLAQFKLEKKEALESGDADRVIALDDEIDKIRRTPVRNVNQTPPEFADWVEKNSWYSDDEDLRLFADGYGTKLFQQNPQRPITDIYADVAKKVKETFSSKFKNPNRETPPAVDTGTRAPAPKAPPSEAEIPKEYKQVFHTMWRAGAWGDISQKDAAKKYVADLIKIGVVEE